MSCAHDLRLRSSRLTSLLAVGVPTLLATAMAASAATIRVPADHATIQAALNAAQNGDTILISSGTYTGPGNRDLDPGGKAVTVESDAGAALCIIDCEELGRAFIMDSGETPATRLVGITMIRGSADGGGALFIEASSPTIVDCVFEANAALGYGGAVVLIDSEATFAGCRFAENGQLWADFPRGGAVWASGGAPSFTRCLFTGNLAIGYCGGRGGGLAFDGGQPTLERCRIVGNQARGDTCAGTSSAFGGGVYAGGGCELQIKACVIEGNLARAAFASESGVARGGGVHCVGASVTLVNCLLNANEARSQTWGYSQGGGFYGVGSLINSTLAANVAISGEEGSAVGGGVAGGPLSVENTIVWDNVPSGIDSSDAVITYSDVQETWPGVGNMSSTPQFVAPALQDFRLSGGSPCLDAGSNGSVPDGITMDLEGLPRFVDDPATADTGLGAPPIVDIGAYEFQVVCIGDVDGSGAVGFADLLLLLSMWGQDEPDLNGNGSVDFGDLLVMLSRWGPC